MFITKENDGFIAVSEHRSSLERLYYLYGRGILVIDDRQSTLIRRDLSKRNVLEKTQVLYPNKWRLYVNDFVMEVTYARKMCA